MLRTQYDNCFTARLIQFSLPVPQHRARSGLIKIIIDKKTIVRSVRHSVGVTLDHS